MQTNFIETNQKTKQVVRGKRTVLAIALLAFAPLLMGIILGVGLADKALHLSQPVSSPEASLSSSKHTDTYNTESSSTTSNGRTTRTGEVPPIKPPRGFEVTDTGSISSATPNPTSTTPAAPKDTTVTSLIAVRLEVGGNVYETQIPESSTVYQLLVQLQDQHQIGFDTKPFGSLGVYVSALNGVSENPLGRKFWIYYINGAKAHVGVSQYQLKPHDVISWKLEDQE